MSSTENDVLHGTLDLLRVFRLDLDLDGAVGLALRLHIADLRPQLLGHALLDLLQEGHSLHSAHSLGSPLGEGTEALDLDEGGLPCRVTTAATEGGPNAGTGQRGVSARWWLCRCQVAQSPLQLLPQVVQPDAVLAHVVLDLCIYPSPACRACLHGS